MISPDAFIHPQALVDGGAVIGARTRVWAFAHVVKGAVVGEDCNLCDHTFIEGKVVAGNRVTVKCGVYLWDGLVVEDDVFIGPAAVFTNDTRPRSGQRPASYPRTLLKQGCSIGAGAVILPALTIGRWAMVGAGSVVCKDVPDFALVVGSPPGSAAGCAAARGSLTSILKVRSAASAAGLIVPSARIKPKNSFMKLSDCTIVNLPKIADPRGNLTFIEGQRHVPFGIKRVFYLYDVPGGADRGGHALKTCQQFLIAMSGSFDVILKNGVEERRIHLNRSYYGLLIPPMIWREMDNFSSGSVCLAVASANYDPADYIRDYGEFLKTIGIVAGTNQGQGAA